jgi:hypothetical protein
MTSNNVSLFSNNISNCLNSEKSESPMKPTNGIFGEDANNTMFNTGMNQNINPNMMTNQMMIPPKEQTNTFNQQLNQMNTGMQNQGINANILGRTGLDQTNMMMHNNMGLMQLSTQGFNKGTDISGQAPITYGTFDHSYSVTKITEQGTNGPLKMKAITTMQNYMAKSMEELRYEDYCLKKSGRSVQKSNTRVGDSKSNLKTILFGSTINSATTTKTTQDGLFGKTITNQQSSLFNQQQCNSLTGNLSNPTLALTPGATISFERDTTGILNQLQTTNINQNQSIFVTNISTSKVQGNQQGGGLFGDNTNQPKSNTGDSLYNCAINVNSYFRYSFRNKKPNQGSGNLFENQPKKANTSTNTTNQTGGLFGNTSTTNITNNQNTSLLFNNNPTQSTNLFSNSTQ